MIRGLVLSFLTGLGLAGDQRVAQPAPGLLYVQVLDGDTLRLANGEKIRGIGWDCPEIEASCDGEYKLAMKATARMALLAGEGLTIERRGYDRYGRTLAIIRTLDGRSVADIMVKARLARPYHGGRRQSWCD